MAQTTRPTTILFVDISKSSRLYELLGDRKAQDIIGNALSCLSNVVRDHGGSVIKTIGDAVLCTFDSTDDAVGAAKSMQLSMDACDPVDDPDTPPIHVHIGMHHGPVVFDSDDIFGDAVNITSRVVDYANPRQIVATRAVIDNLPDDAAHPKKYLANITAKNISGEIELFEIIFESQQTTVVLDSRKLSEALLSSLHLVWGGREIVVDAQKPLISVGRESYNDIEIRYSWISRTHAYIQYRSGLFMIQDKSTNGSYVYPNESAPVRIHKSEHPLKGAGTIIFGREREDGIPDDFADTIGYAVK